MPDASSITDPENARRRLLERAGRTDGGCLLWTGSLDDDGYGKISVEGRLWATHRLSYLLSTGILIPGKPLDHTCHSKSCDLRAYCPHRRCIEPSHLEPVSLSENARRGRTGMDPGGLGPRYDATGLCSKGHPWTEQNIRIRRRAGDATVRVCFPCEQERMRRYKART